MTDNIDANPNKARESQARQVGIERAEKRRKKQEKRGEGSSTKAGGIITTGAVELVAAHMQSLLDAEAAKSKKITGKAWYHHLRWLPAKVTATYALRGMVDAIGAGWTFNNTAVQMANSINAVLLHETLKQSHKGRDILTQIAQLVKSKPGSQYTLREKAIYHAGKRKSEDVTGFAVQDENGNDLYVWSEEMANTVKGQVAGFMISSVMQVTNLFETELVKKKPSDPHQGEKYLKFTDEAVAELASLHEFLDAQTPQFGPMFNIPFAWDADSVGPYDDLSLAQQVPLVKHMSPDQKKAINNALKSNQMPEAVEAINTLQEVPLTLNEKVVEAVEWVRERIVESGGTLQVNSFPNLMEVPELAKVSTEEYESWSADEQRDFKREQLAARKTNRRGGC